MTRSLFLVLLAVLFGCSSPDSVLVVTDPVLRDAVQGAADAWNAAGVLDTPPIAPWGLESAVQAVSDATFEAQCTNDDGSAPAPTVVGCTSHHTQAPLIRIWLRESLLQDPALLLAIVTHEFGHGLEADGLPNHGHLPKSAGCDATLPPLMCAWGGPAITAADVALVLGE